VLCAGSASCLLVGRRTAADIGRYVVRRRWPFRKVRRYWLDGWNWRRRPRPLCGARNAVVERLGDGLGYMAMYLPGYRLLHLAEAIFMASPVYYRLRQIDLKGRAAL
jgi:hypothetical protein